jgi:hypothetical protein
LIELFLGLGKLLIATVAVLHQLGNKSQFQSLERITLP